MLLPWRNDLLHYVGFLIETGIEPDTNLVRAKYGANKVSFFDVIVKYKCRTRFFGIIFLISSFKAGNLILN